MNRRTAAEQAERKSRARALSYLGLAALLAVLMVVVCQGLGGDFAQGLWAGVLLGCALNLMPIQRWLRPRSEVAQLMEDEVTRDYRRSSSTAGFWVAIGTAIILGLPAREGFAIDGWLMGQLVASAGTGAAMVTFAFLELRALRDA